ncbi:hypothetical protein HA052_04865 [Chromobacterium haemolyticum]|uniref:Uncharacterized protein n=1 Tax=Chromobacterium fluminis TaxID=3044269 RepID=A0ABX0KY90_9NEIS|nr:hypothetical protein [Chromobacterium haemolyticum]NHR04522.1 hypothetical protein [Chromobacterium haemolyticum]
MKHFLALRTVADFVGTQEEVEFWLLDPSPQELLSDDSGILGQPVLSECLNSLVSDTFDSDHCLSYYLKTEGTCQFIFALPDECLCLVDPSEYSQYLVHESIHVIIRHGIYELVKMELNPAGGVILIDDENNQHEIPTFVRKIPDYGELQGRVRAFLTHVLPV